MTIEYWTNDLVVRYVGYQELICIQDMHRQFCRTVVHEPSTIRCHLQSYNIVVSKEVKRRIEYIMSCSRRMLHDY